MIWGLGRHTELMWHRKAFQKGKIEDRYGPLHCELNILFILLAFLEWAVISLIVPFIQVFCQGQELLTVRKAVWWKQNELAVTVSQMDTLLDSQIRTFLKYLWRKIAVTHLENNYMLYTMWQ